MKIFDQNGMMIIPTPFKEELRMHDKAIAVKQCFCPKGHNLISSRASFNGQHGILLKAKKGDQEGLIALSPIYGDKSRISFDIDLYKDDIIELSCPTCNTPLPSYSDCACGGEMQIMFTTEKLVFSDCIGVCNKIDCFNSTIKSQNEMLTYAILDNL